MLRPALWSLALAVAATDHLTTGGLVTTIAAGAAGSFAHEAFKSIDRRTLGKLLSRQPGIAENHVVVQALYQSHLDALDALLTRFNAVPRDKGSEVARFATVLVGHIADGRKSAKTLGFLWQGVLSEQEEALRAGVLEGLPDAFDDALAGRRSAEVSRPEPRRFLEGVVLAELRLTLVGKGEDFPPPFADLFTGTHGGWFDLFIRAAAERIKADPGFAAIWNAEQVAAVKAINEAQIALLHEIVARLRTAEENAQNRHREELRLLREQLQQQSEMLERQARHTEAIEALRREMAREKGVDPQILAPLFGYLGHQSLTLDEMRERAEEAIQAILTRADEAVVLTNESADIAAIIMAARARLKQLDTVGARAILAGKIAEEKARRLIPLLGEQLAIARLEHDHATARETLRELAAIDPDDPWHWFELGDSLANTHTLNDALLAYRNGQRICERLARADPDNAGWQRDLSVSHNKIGDVQTAQGNLPAALASFQASHDIFARLAQADPDNAGWQRDLSVSLGKIGDVQAAQGNLPAALASFQASLAIRQSLAQADPDNAGWQRDLVVSFIKIGQVREAAHDCAAAQASYEQALALMQPLADRDPSNAIWREDLAWVRDRLAGMASGGGT